MNPRMMPDAAAGAPEPAMPEMPEMEHPAAGNPEQHAIPLSALAMPDEAEQMVNPAPGDHVTYTVEGTIESINGDVATVKVAAVNGAPVSSKQPEQETYDDLKASAEEMES